MSQPKLPRRARTTGALVLLALLPIGSVTADERPTGEMQSRREWFQSLFEPGTDSSCCDMADCKRTTAAWRKGGWWAVVQGKWRSIPGSSVLKGPHSIDGEAYVCSGDTTDGVRDGGRLPRIYCFVPPDFGS